MPIAITPITTPTPIVKSGSWKSWFALVKPWTVAISTPSAIQNATTPSDITNPSAKHFARLPCAACERPMIFSGITGSTHGVKLRSRPPAAAIRRRSRNPAPFGSIENFSVKMLNSSSSLGSSPDRILP